MIIYSIHNKIVITVAILAQVCLWHSTTNPREPFSRSRTASPTSTCNISMSHTDPPKIPHDSSVLENLQWSCDPKTYEAAKAIAYRIFDDYDIIFKNHAMDIHPGIEDLRNLLQRGFSLAEANSLPSEFSSALKALLEKIEETAKPPYIDSVHGLYRCIRRTFFSIETAFMRNCGLYKDEDELEAPPFPPQLVSRCQDGQAGYSCAPTNAWLELASSLPKSDTMSQLPLLLESDTMSQPSPLLRSNTNFVGATGDN